MWIADVVPEEVISSSAWGNPIRDRVWQTFANRAERNAHGSDGMMGICLDDRSTWEYRAGAWYPHITNWRPWTPFFYWGSPNPDPSTIITTSVVPMMRRVGDVCEVTFEGALLSQGYAAGLLFWFSLPQQPVVGGMLAAGCRIINQRNILRAGPYIDYGGNFTITGAHGSVNLPFFHIASNDQSGLYYTREQVADVNYTFSINCRYRTTALDDTPLALP